LLTPGKSRFDDFQEFPEDLNFTGIKNFFFGKSVSALTLGSIALTNTNENLLDWIYCRVVGCFWVGGMKLADPDIHE